MWQLSEPSYVDEHRKHVDLYLPRNRNGGASASSPASEKVPATTTAIALRNKASNADAQGLGGGTIPRGHAAAADSNDGGNSVGGGALTAGQRPPRIRGRLIPVARSSSSALEEGRKAAELPSAGQAVVGGEDVGVDEDYSDCLRVFDAGPSVIHRCRGKHLTAEEDALRVRRVNPDLHCDQPVVAW